LIIFIPKKKKEQKLGYIRPENQMKISVFRFFSLAFSATKQKLKIVQIPPHPRIKNTNKSQISSCGKDLKLREIIVIVTFRSHKLSQSLLVELKLRVPTIQRKLRVPREDWGERGQIYIIVGWGLHV